MRWIFREKEIRSCDVEAFLKDADGIKEKNCFQLGIESKPVKFDSLKYTVFIVLQRWFYNIDFYHPKWPDILKEKWKEWPFPKPGMYYWCSWSEMAPNESWGGSVQIASGTLVKEQLISTRSNICNKWDIVYWINTGIYPVLTYLLNFWRNNNNYTTVVSYPNDLSFLLPQRLN